MDPLVIVGLVALGALIAFVVWMFVAEYQAGREEIGHNDRDYECRFWWGDRSGSVVGVANERCLICNPEEG